MCQVFPRGRGVSISLPDTIQLLPSETILYSIQSDLTLDRKFGESFVFLTNKRIIAVSAESIRDQAFLSDIDAIVCRERYGSVQLSARTPGKDALLASGTLAFAPEFHHLSRLANQKIQNNPDGLVSAPPLSSAYCRRCGAPIPEREKGCCLCINKRAVIRRLIGLVVPYRLAIGLLILGTVLSVVASTAQPYITKVIVDSVIGGGLRQLLLDCILGLAGCNALLLIARFLSNSVNSWLSARLVADLRSRMHRRLQYLRLDFFLKRQTGEIVGRVMNDTAELQNFLTGGLPYFLVNSLSLVVIAAFLFRLDVRLAMMVLIPVPLLLGGGRWFWSRLIPLYSKHGAQISAVHSNLNESVRGIRVIKAFCREESRSAEFERRNRSLFRTSVKVERNSIAFSEVMFFVMSVGVTGVWYFASRRMLSGSPGLTMGDLLAFVGYIWLFYGPLQWFTAVLNWLTHALAAAERIFSVLDSTPETQDSSKALFAPRLEGAISFDDVWFSYEQGKPVLRNLEVRIVPGEMIGLVGRSGAGKSTLINLISRFYVPDSGLIRIDGYPIEVVNLKSLRQQIGMVQQDPVLFNCSIYENIRYGKHDASFEEVVRAAKAASAHEFILNKEDGYDTVIGENGCRLSGGEKQRISIARAILHDPPILILDEATSSVDTETEAYIQEAIARLVQGRTTIAVAHRLATLRNANRLLVMDNGSIVEDGSHEELMGKRGFYWKLVQCQSGSAFLNPDIVSVG
jgi:ATP-binding cassette, subfamily B, bacterial